MRFHRLNVVAIGLSSLLVVALGATACDSSSDTGGTKLNVDCADYQQYGDLSGKTVTIYTGIVTPEDTPHIQSYQPFEQCTGATVRYEGDKAFETQILVRARAGNPPDLAIVPQPGLLAQLVETGAAKPAPSAVSQNADEWWDPAWKAYGTVKGTFYAAPLGSSVKSLVWYSPKEFRDKGYTVPKTLDELYALSDKIAATGKKPWCAGIGSGEATGWPLTDWMEDMMLRLSGPQAYDKWVQHDIPFNSPEAVAALNEVGKFLRNEKYVNGGLGGVKSIASTTFQDGGLPILQGACSLHRQASFYAANWPPGTTVAEDGDVFAFYLPGRDQSSKPVLSAGEFILAFSDRPEVQAFQAYLSTSQWANNKAKVTPQGGWVSANKGLDKSNLTSPIDRLAADIFQDPTAVTRFDGSDLMPGAVGANSFWRHATSWITGQSTEETLNAIEASWPS